MRRLVVGCLLFWTLGAAPSRTQTYVEGQTIEPEDVTENEDNIFAYLQAGVDTYRANSIATAALQDAAVTTAKIATGAVTTTIVLDSTLLPADIANADWGDFTVSGNSATIDANAVALSTDTTGNYVATVADSGSSTVTVSGSGSEGAAVTLLVTDVSCTNCLGMTELAATLTAADGDLIDLDAINVSSATEGLLLPQNTSCTSGTAEGQICWDTDNDTLQMGTGSATKTIGGAWIFVESITLSGTSTTSSTLPTTTNLILLVLENVIGTGAGLALRVNADSGANYDYATMSDSAFASATGQTLIRLNGTSGINMNGTILFGRPSVSAAHWFVINLASNGLTNALAYRARWTTNDAITTVNFSDTTSISGTVHIYRAAN